MNYQIFSMVIYGSKQKGVRFLRIMNIIGYLWRDVYGICEVLKMRTELHAVNG